MRRFLYLVFVSALMPVAAIAPPTFARGEPSVSSDGAWRLDSVYPAAARPMPVTTLLRDVQRSDNVTRSASLPIAPEHD